MDKKRTCSGCQKPLEGNAPDGLCPECLLRAGLGTGVDMGPDTKGGSGLTPFVAPSLQEVARLFPQLEVLGFIGQGGMGAVYKTRQRELDRVVALKILPPDIGQDSAFAERFTREAKALAKLNHPGVVTLYEFGKADGLFFFLMEFVDGVSLRRLLKGQRISAREALAIVPQICDALQYAHDQGVVHRDIKPENILLDRQGRIKVADFGLAKLAETQGEAKPGTAASPPSACALTGVGKVMGTPQYMAPEQRDHPTEVDHRADIYSLGVVFYEMLTGEVPRENFILPSRRIRVDVRLDEVVLHALEKEPERRYQQANQVKADVETIKSVALTQYRWGVRLGVAGVILAALVLLGIGLHSWLVPNDRQGARRSPPSSATTRTFGPVIEQVIAVGNGRNSFYRLHPGEFVAAADGSDPTAVHEPSDLCKWLTEQNVDLLVQRQNGKPVLALSDMVTANLDLQDFNRLTPQALSENRAWLAALNRPNPDRGPALTGLLGDPMGKSVVAFQTRYGVTGLLEVLGTVSEPLGVRIRYRLVLPTAPSLPRALETPRAIVAEWLLRLKMKASTSSVLEVTTGAKEAEADPSLPSLREFDQIRPMHQLGNGVQAMIVSNPFRDNAGQICVLYAILRKREGRWLLDRQGITPSERASDLMEGFRVHPGVKCDVVSEELVGTWHAPCLTLTLAADGTGVHTQTGPKGAQKRDSLTWEVSGSTLVTRWSGVPAKWEITRIDDDSFQVDYSPDDVDGRVWTWRRSAQKAEPNAAFGSDGSEEGRGVAPRPGAEKSSEVRLDLHVVDPGNHPAADARVAEVSPALTTVAIRGGTLTKSASGTTTNGLIFTDASGGFSVSLVPNRQTFLVVTHDAGFACVPSELLPDSKQIVLRTWGRIAGQVWVGRNPGSGLKAALLSSQRRPNLYQILHYDYEADTDQEGRFTIERVPPGWVEVGYLSPDGSPGGQRITCRTRLEVQAGATARVTVGGSGRPVIGRILPPPDLEHSIEFGWGVQALDSKRPSVPRPPSYAGWSEEEQRAWNAAWYESPEGVRTMQDYWQSAEYRHYSFAVHLDGTFRIEDVPAGTYTLLVWTEESPFASKSPPKRIAALQRDVVVPPMPGGRSDEPFDLGSLKLERVSE